MEIDYKKLLELYYGYDIHNYINEVGDQIYKIHGNKVTVVLNQWILIPKEELEYNDILNKYVKAFDIIYEYTDKNNSGLILDFEFNKVFVSYKKIEQAIDSNKKIARSLLENLKEIKFFSALHKGEVILGNWGFRGTNRFKKMLFGSEVDYCKEISIAKIRDDINFLSSEEFRNAAGDKKKFKEIEEYGDVVFYGKNKGKLYEMLL